MRKVLVIILSAIVSSFAYGQSTVDYNNPQMYEVAEIEARGLQYLDNGAVISITGIQVGDNISIPGDDISFAIKKLWKQGLFSDISLSYEIVEGRKIKVYIDLVERPRLTQYVFNGVRKSKQSELSDELTLVKGRILTDASIKNAELNIVNYYKDKGFLNVKVESETKIDSLLGNGVKLIFLVDRGQKIRIDEINFIGNENFSDRRLKSKMKETNEKLHFTLFDDLFLKALHTKPKGWFKFLTEQKEVSNSRLVDYLAENVNVNFFKSSKLVKSEYKADKANVITFYNNKGYRDAEIISDSVYQNSKGDMIVDIEVNEGNKYYFRDIQWQGNFVHSDKTLDQILNIKTGDVYDLEKITKKLNYDPIGGDISSLYMDNGYLFFNVTPVEVRVENDSIDLELRIYEGSKATIKEVNISGNTRTNDHVIIRELQTIPGEYFSRRELIETQRRLTQLGYFNPETVNPVPVPNGADGTVDINWELEEVSNDQVQLSGGWGGQIGFVGSLGITFNNFSLSNFLDFGNWDPLPVGDGQVLSVSFQANGRQYQSYNFSFTEPWLGGKKPNALTVGGSFSKIGQITGYTANRRPEINGSFQILRGFVSLARRLKWPDNFFTLSNTLEYSKYILNNYNRNLGCSNCDANNIIFKTTLARNSVDNPIFPRRGSNISLAVALTPPYSLFNNLDYDQISFDKSIKFVEYNKWMFDASFFNTIIGDLVVNTRANFGIINNYRNDVSVGPFERFILGGSGLGGQNILLGSEIIGLRGYDDNSLAPNEIVNDPTSSDAISLRGGTIYNKFVMELRYPLSLNPSATIYLLGFGEAGNTWSNFDDYNPYNLKRSAGVGARIFMPAFGTIGIDWGYGFDKVPGSDLISGGQVHFTIGNQLR